MMTGQIDGLGRAPKRVNDGNVRTTPLPSIYRNSPIFKDLRNPDKLKGKYGVCAFKYICGGSRSKTFAMTGDYMERKPSLCIYSKNITKTEKQSIKTNLTIISIYRFDTRQRIFTFARTSAF